MADRNLVLQLLITAKDEASAIFGKLFGYLDNNTRVVANQIREAFTGLFGGAVDGAADFEAQLDRVIAKGDQTYQSYAQLATQIRQVGAQFGLSGTEAAKGMESLAAAGLSAADAIATLPQVLALASAEQISADAAATKLIDSLSIMGLGFDQAGRMADVLAKGANITTSSASQLAEALSEAGGAARAAGMNLESTVAALDLLHKNGIKGSEAGTALKAILTALIDPSSKASQELDQLGISSRDLGSVLDALKSRGGEANAAILAFGQEAGPGLRALLGEGKAGLDAYTAQLNQAGGAAAEAAEQMGGNLNSAMATLKSAWETVKESLLEPALKPLADAAREAASALQDTLSTTAFQAAKDAIGAFVANGIAAAKAFVAAFDFSQLAPAIEGFATRAQAVFADLARYAGIAADGIKLVWNGVTLAVQAVAIVLTGFTATIATSVSTITQGLAKIGAVSEDSAAAIERAAAAARAGVVALRDGIATDAGDMKAAWDGINQKIGETPPALGQIPPKVKEVKAAIDSLQPPDLGGPQELQPLIQNLDYYRTKLKMAEDAQREASVAAREAERVYLDISNQLKAGTASQDNYDLALQRVKATQEAESKATVEAALARSRLAVETQAVTTGINEESTAVTNSIKSKKALYDENQRQIEITGGVIAAQQRHLTASRDLADVEYALAKVKGDQQAIAEKGLALLQRELEVLKGKRAEEQNELEHYRAIGERIADLTRRKDILTAADAAELAALKQKYPAIAEDIAAREKTVVTIDRQIEGQQREVKQAEIMAGPVGQLSRLYAEQAQEHERAADASERHYQTQLNEIDGAIRVAQARGDEAQAADLLQQKQQLLIDQADAKASADAQAYQDAQRAIEAKTLEAAADGELTEAEKEQLAAMEDVAAAKQAAAQQSLDNADALRAEARANEEAAAAAEQAAAAQQRAADDADRNARRMASVTSYAGEALDQLNAKGKAALDAIGKGYEHAGYTMQNMNRALAEEVRALDGAAQAEIAAADRLKKLQAAAEGVGPGADRAREALANLARGGGAGIRGITAAGEQAIATLEGIKAAAEQAAQSLADMAEDYRRQMLQLQGDQAGLLEAEHEDNLRRLEELHQASGDYGNDEYNQAVARANQLHSLKLKQLREQEEEQRRRDRDSAGGTAEDLDRLTEAAERTQKALSGLAGVSLSGLAGQARDLKGHFQGLNELL